MVALFLQTFSHCAATHGETHFEGFSRFEGSGSCVSSGLGHESHMIRHYYIVVCPVSSF
jgi:hypothetical protein